jgi:hypothetical protein
VLQESGTNTSQGGYCERPGRFCSDLALLSIHFESFRKATLLPQPVHCRFDPAVGDLRHQYSLNYNTQLLGSRKHRASYTVVYRVSTNIITILNKQLVGNAPLAVDQIIFPVHHSVACASSWQEISYNWKYWKHCGCV